MVTIDDFVRHLDGLAPRALSEEWDNVGLLIGDLQRVVNAVMTCLTLTDATVAEARDEGADLVIAHHPLPFRPLRTVTTEATAGRLVWELAAAQVSVYSAHTAFDSCAVGINERLAVGLELQQARPLRRVEQVDDELGGGGRIGDLNDAMTLRDLIDRVKSFLRVPQVQYVGELDRSVRRMAIACGAADEFLHDAVAAECDVFLLGESRFHTMLEAEAYGVAMIMPGHYASERFAMESLAAELDKDFPQVRVWAARHEADPLKII